ncbi:MAG: hypothetical protein ACRC6V_09275 [Bacteroidales bacterium]
MAFVPKHFEEYLKHPLLVKDDEFGFPLLEPGKFYMIMHSSWRWDSSIGYMGKVWKCGGKMKHTKAGENHLGSTSCFMTSPTIGKTGVTYFGFQYVWFGKGGNIVIELPEGQQRAYAAFESALNKEKDDCQYRWDLRAVDCNV